MEDDTPKSEYQLYTRRWYILGIFSWFTFMQCFVWATWGPISTNAQAVYGWNDDTIALLANWGPIIYLPTSFFFSWVIDVKGVRPAMLLSCALTAIGSGIRCFTTTNPSATALMHLGHILNAAAGPTAMSVPSKLSQEWFPPNERTTSTAIGVQANLLGLAISFVLGPQLVSSSDSSVILRYLYIQTIFTIPPLLCALIYFPNKPPTPPSLTAAGEHHHMTVMEFLNGLKVLVQNKQFVILALSYGISSGFYNGWSSVLNVNLSSLGYDEDSAGWVGFAGTIAGCAGGVLIGAFADKFKRMKLLLLSLFGVATLFFVYFALGCIGVVPNSQTLMIVVASLGGFFLNTSLPLFYELSVEVSHPVGEGTVAIALTDMNNVGCMIFLFLPIAYFGTAWMNWALAGVCAAFGFILIFFKEEYVRYNLDTQKSTKHVAEENGYHYQVLKTDPQQTVN